MVEQDRYKTLKEQTEATRWPPGKSGNDAGRPVKAVTTLLKNIDELTTEQIAKVIIKHVLAGDLGFLKEYLDRVEGKVTDTHRIEGDSPVSINLVPFKCKVCGHDEVSCKGG